MSFISVIFFRVDLPFLSEDLTISKTHSLETLFTTNIYSTFSYKSNENLQVKPIKEIYKKYDKTKYFLTEKSSPRNDLLLVGKGKDNYLLKR